MEQSPLSMFLLLSTWFVLSYTAIYYFCIMIKDFSISFSRVIIVQDFETVTFLCVICMQAGLLCYFLLNEKGAHFKSVQ